MQKTVVLPLTVNPSAGGTVLLEDFSAAVRLNDQGTPIFSLYLGENSNQSGSWDNATGTYKMHVGSGESYFQFLPGVYRWPGGFAQSWKKAGTFDPNCNRLWFWVKGGGNVNGQWEIGTYVKPHSDTDNVNQGTHYYHKLYCHWQQGKWHLCCINRRPQHKVGANVGTNWPDDPEWPAYHYFDGLTRFYCNGIYANYAGDWFFDDFRFETVTGEPDDLVASIVAVYEGTRYAIHWDSIKNTSKVYDVAYKASSMKGAGFASGTPGGIVANPGSDYIDCHWYSPVMAENAGGMYLAIRPQGRTDFTEVFLPRRV